MRVVSFLFFAVINVATYFSALYFAKDTTDPAQTIFVLWIAVWLSFVLCLSLFVAGASSSDGTLELPRSATQLLLLCGLFPMLGFSLGLTLNFQNYQQLAVSMQQSRGGQVERVDGSLARLSGEIGPKSLSTLKEEHRRSKIEYLELDSIGGLIDVADDIADFLSLNRISTFVQADCESACVIVALSGEQLLVTPASRFGFHRGSSAANINSELGRFISKTATADMIEMLRRKGVPQEILSRAEKTPANSMYYVSGQEMYRIGLADRIID